MNGKIFSQVIEVQEIPVNYLRWDDNKREMVLTTYEIDEFKKKMKEYYDQKKLSLGKYRNIMTATNVFTEHILKKKRLNNEVEQQIITRNIVQNGKITKVSIKTDAFVLTSQDLIEFFETIYSRVALHTFRVYLFYVKYLLEKILERRGEYIEEYFRPSIFDPEKYVLGSHDYGRKSQASPLYIELDRKKFVNISHIRDALEYLSIIKHKVDNNQIGMSQLTYDRLKIATLLLIFTGARGTEINDLMVADFNFRKGYIVFRRNKFKSHPRETVVPLHPYLKEELQNFIRDYQLKKDNHIFEWKHFDKIIKHYYTPKRVLKTEKKKIKLNKREYPTDKTIITTRMFRKFWDNYAEGRMDSKYKNYLLGRYVGVDMEHYVSVIHNKRVFNKLKSEYMKVFSDLPRKLEKQLKKI